MGKTPETLSNENQKELFYFPGEESFNWAQNVYGPERQVREAMIFINMTGEGAIGKRICGIEQPKEENVIVDDDVSNTELNFINKILLIAAEKKGSPPEISLALSIFQKLLVLRNDTL